MVLLHQQNQTFTQVTLRIYFPHKLFLLTKFHTLNSDKDKEKVLILKTYLQ